MRAVLPLLLVLHTVAAEPAPAPPIALATAREAWIAALRSGLVDDDPLLRAWSARGCARSSASECLAELVDACRRIPSADDQPRWAAYDAALDALVVLARPVPDEVVAAAAEDRPAQAVSLAARDPANHLAALAAIADRTRNDACWFAAAALQARERSPVAARRLLADLVLRLEVEVSVPGVGGGRNSYSRRFGMGRHVALPGFPPPVVFALSEGAEPGSVVVIEWPRVIVATRFEGETTDFAYCQGGTSIARDPARIELLRMMLRGGGGAFEATTHLFLLFDDGGDDSVASFPDRVRKAYDDLASERAALIDALVREGLVTADEAADLPAGIVVHVDDRRPDQVPPLPVLPYPPPPGD